MKILKTILALFISLTVTAQAVQDITYFDIPTDQVGEFVQTHKKFMDATMNDERKVQGQWVYRHFYGSGASVAVFTDFANINDAVNDDPWASFRSKWQSSNEDERKELEALGQKYASFLVNHSDDIRSFNFENNFVGKENVDWDIPFILVVGNYNVNKPNASIAGNAFMEWRTKPGVGKGLQLGGGYTTHFSGSGPDLQLFSGFKNIVDFAKSVSTDDVSNSEASSAFWSEITGDHEDQIYIHVGHLVNGKFDLAGPNN
jgi:hypothetical protein